MFAVLTTSSGNLFQILIDDGKKEFMNVFTRKRDIVLIFGGASLPDLVLVMETK